jgi:hypothetical protein
MFERILSMPRRTARISYAGKLAEPRVLTTSEWIALESAFGRPIPDRVRRKVGLVVLAMTMRIPKEKNALTVAQARSKIEKFKNQAGHLRRLIWYGEGERASEILGLPTNEKHGKPEGLDIQTIEKRFFRMEKSIVKDLDGTSLQLLAHSLDSVIATCDLILRQLANSDSHLRDGFFTTACASMLYRIFKSHGLRPTMRKDTDKIHSDSQYSPFLRFFDELCSILQLPSVTKTALPGRVHRFDVQLNRALSTHKN